MKRTLVGGVVAMSVVGLSLITGATLAAAETWEYGSYNCGSSLVESRSVATGYTTHTHRNGTQTRSQGFAANSSVTRYYASGFTSVSSITLVAPDIHSGGRACDS